ncbi:MAG: AAA family ATPase [Pyrobaculum sp.]|jgi:MoxR-like ATPase
MSKKIQTPQTSTQTPAQSFQTNSYPAQTQTPAQPPADSAQNRVEEARQRLLAVESALNKLVIGHENVVKALMTALTAREHIVLIGPPGTAKTMLATTAAKLLGAKCYTYLMTRFTTPEELFGMFDILALNNGELKRRWTSIVDSELAFLDEIFKGSGPILNTLLSLMQERVIYDAATGQPMATKLWTLIGASNEVPLEEELQAVYDRFAVRVFLQYLDDDNKLLEALMARWVNSTTPKQLATMDDVRVLHEFAVTLLRSKIKNLGEVVKLYFVNAAPLIKTLRSRGVMVSDRMVIEKFALLYASRLALYGITPENIVNAIYDTIPLIARTPQEAAEIQKVIEDSLGEVAELSKKLEQAKSMLKKDEEGALKIFKEIASYDVSRLANKPWLKPRVEAIIRVAQDYAQKTQQIIQQKKALLEG